LSDVFGLRYLFVIAFVLSMLPNMAFIFWARRNRERLG